MAKFSVGREDGGVGPSSPRPKKQRLVLTWAKQQQQFQTDEHRDEYGVEEMEPEYEVEEEEEEVEEEDGESEGSEEEEEEEEEEEGGADDQNEAVKTNAGLPAVVVPCKNGRDLASSSGDGSITVTLTDSDVLDCPICLEHLTIPVFQCENGHVACSCCCIKLGNKCASCSWPIGYNRCRAIEKVVESAKVPCQNVKYGCKEIVSYNCKRYHEKSCIYSPCSCPLLDCYFVGSSKHLSLHFSSNHSNSAKRFSYNCLFPVNIESGRKYLILQEQNEGTIFILNNAIELLGNVVNLSCIGPSSTKRGFAYDLKARKGPSSVGLQSFTETISVWVEHPPRKEFLLVPSDFVGSGGLLKLDLCIGKNGDFPAPI